MSVVAAAHDRALDGMPETRTRAAGSLIEIARVLFEYRRQNGAAEKCADGDVRVGSAESFAVAGGPLPITAKRVLRLLDSCDEADAGDRERIQIGSPCEFHFLF